MEKKQYVIKRRCYSEALRVEVANAINSGRMTISAVTSYYGVPPTTARSWADKYGEGTKHQIVEVVMKDQSDKIRELESALADAHIKLKIYDTALQLAAEDHGLEVKKNFSTGQFQFVKKSKKSKLLKGVK